MRETSDSLNKTSDRAACREIAAYSAPAKRGRCLACGTEQMKRGRRYCSRECRQHMHWVLSLSKGLLRTFNARYAAFSFTREHVILDVLPVWADGISRFLCPRANGNKPAEDLKNLVLQWGSEWHQMVDNNNSKSFASLCLLNRNQKDDINPKSIKPDRKDRPRFSKHEKDCMKILKLGKEDLSSENSTHKIKSAYKSMAKRYHPDMGGDAEKFKKLSEAHQQMLTWARNPQYTCRKALRDWWSYDGFTNRWSPPL